METLLQVCGKNVYICDNTHREKDEVQFGDEKQTQEGAAEPSLLLFHSESLN